MMRVISSCSAAAIRASSCVNLSNLSTLSSISLSPVNFLKYFSEWPVSENGKYKPLHQLTESSTLHFLCRDRKDGQHLNHNLNDYVSHSPSRCDASIFLKPAEEMFNAVKALDQLVLASAHIFSRLSSVSK
jgi:hypothetical protein